MNNWSKSYSMLLKKTGTGVCTSIFSDQLSSLHYLLNLHGFLNFPECVRECKIMQHTCLSHEMFPYKNCVIENVGLLFRAWYSSTMWPLEHISHTRDIFICEHFGTLYWKKPFSGETETHWCVADDNKIIIHPCEPHLHLTVIECEDGKLYIAWQEEGAKKCANFMEAYAAMKADILEDSCEVGTVENPMEINWRIGM